MPLAFPSHQGIAWPFRGELGQWLGHSLLGVVVAVLPGLWLTRLARRATPRTLVARLDEGSPASPGPLCLALSVGLGALSHLVTDLVTHRKLLLLWPWYRHEHPFPSWWYHEWGGIPLLVYPEPYPIAPHTLAWCVLTALGIWLFVRCLRRSR
ncbi:MAG: metal-dependent hydrolase [Planctomycetota bacterium]